MTYLPVEKNGLLDIQKFRNAIQPDTLLASVMAVNNEIGVIQPLKQLGAACREKGGVYTTFPNQTVFMSHGKILTLT